MPQQSLTMGDHVIVELFGVDGGRGGIDEQNEVERERVGLGVLDHFLIVPRPFGGEAREAGGSKGLFEHERAEGMAHEKDAVWSIRIAVAPGGVAAGVNRADERDAGDFIFRRIFAAPITELFGRPIEEVEFAAGATRVDDRFAAEGLGGGSEVFVLAIEGVRKSVAAPGEVNAVHAVTAFFGEGRGGDALEKTVEADDIAGLGIILPAVDVNEDEETFAALGEFADFGVG